MTFNAERDNLVKIIKTQVLFKLLGNMDKTNPIFAPALSLYQNLGVDLLITPLMIQGTLGKTHSHFVAMEELSKELQIPLITNPSIDQVIPENALVFQRFSFSDFNIMPGRVQEQLNDITHLIKKFDNNISLVLFDDFSNQHSNITNSFLIHLLDQNKKSNIQMNIVALNNTEINPSLLARTCDLRVTPSVKNNIQNIRAKQSDDISPDNSKNKLV